MKTTSDIESAIDKNKIRHNISTFRSVDGKRKHIDPEIGLSDACARNKRDYCVWCLTN